MSQPIEQPNQTVNDDEAEFVPLKGFEADYEIQKEFPFVIRKKSNNRIIAEGDYRKNGYPCVSLNNKLFYKHKLVAKQFLDNPNNLPEVDHISRDRTDYHLSNLRYVSRSLNQQNKTSYKGVKVIYVDDIPDSSTIIDF